MTTGTVSGEPRAVLEGMEALERKIARAVEVTQALRAERALLRQEIVGLHQQLDTLAEEKRQLERRIDTLISGRRALRDRVEAILDAIATLELEAESVGK